MVEKPIALPQEDNMERPETSTPGDMLFSLPPELLLIIFEFVGPLNFRQDLRRLHVSRRWYPYARPVLHGSLRWSTENLPSIYRVMRKNSAALATAQQLTKHIDLTLHAYYDPITIRRDPRPWNLNIMERLASDLKDFTALRTLTLRANTRTGMPSHVVPSFASLSQLTSLEMDLVRMDFEQDTHHHLCESISQLIPNLKSLRCRLPYICEQMLDLQPGNLKELVISISTCSFYSCRSYRRSPEHCSGRLSGRELRGSLESRLIQFAASMRKPRIVRLIYDFRSGPWPCAAFDAIHNQRLLLDYQTRLG